MEYRISSWLGFLVILAIIVPTGWYCYKKWDLLEKEIISYQHRTYQAIMNKKVTEAEKDLIDKWITENNLNEYGDPKDTVYTGGNPLFNEQTGKTTDKYLYILKQHPSRPWLK